MAHRCCSQMAVRGQGIHRGWQLVPGRNPGDKVSKLFIVEGAQRELHALADRSAQSLFCCNLADLARNDPEPTCVKVCSQGHRRRVFSVPGSLNNGAIVTGDLQGSCESCFVS